MKQPLSTFLSRAALCASAICICVCSFSADVRAERRASALTKSWARQCPITGLGPLKQFVKRGEYQCYSKLADVTGLGYTPFVKIRRAARRASSPSCKFLGIDALKTFFQQSKLRCFSSAKAAKKAKFKKLVLPTPTPTPTPDSEPLKATPTPGAPSCSAASCPQMNFAFHLGEHVAGSGYQGDCTASLAAGWGHLDVHCTHNVNGATSAHLHVVPNNDRTCEILNPALTFDLSCDLTAEDGAGVGAGNGLIAIHLSPGAEGQAAAGLIRN